MAGPLAVLGQALHSLVDEAHVLLVDVEPQQAQAPRGAATDAVQELQRLTHQVVAVLIVLTAQEVLNGMERDEPTIIGTPVNPNTGVAAEYRKKVKCLHL